MSYIHLLRAALKPLPGPMEVKSRSRNQRRMMRAENLEALTPCAEQFNVMIWGFSL
jgi:hypothetical protein